MKHSKFFCAILILSACLGLGYLYIAKNKKYDYPIDLVYTWVDGNDKAWLSKKLYWQKKLKIIDNYAIGKQRFRDREELKHSLRSVERYMPWVRNIYIITDNQVPSWLNLKHPKIKIIDHKDILPNDALPVFNSMAIETGLANIDGLSENFIYFNDDIFVNKPVTPDFFFTKDGKPIIYDDPELREEGLARIRQNDQATWVRLWKKTMDDVASKYKTEPFVIAGTHTAAPFNKTDFQNVLNDFKEGFEKTSYSKFRNPDDFNIGIVDMANHTKNRIVLRDYNNIDPKFNCSVAGILIMSNMNDIKYMDPCLFCLNDANYHDDTISLKHTEYLRKRFPNKSSFEK